MKKPQLLCLALFAFVFNANAQEISYGFTANYACEYAELDSVLIENLTQGGDTILYYPDTVLTIIFSGIDPVTGGRNGFTVAQNYPNPFEIKTDIDVFVPEHDDYTLNVYDIAGKKVACYEGKHERGIHQFSFFAGNAKSYILTVNSRKYLQQVQMIQFGETVNTSPHIEYNGSKTMEVPDIKLISLRSYFSYELQDELKFTAYVSGDCDSTTDSPSGSRNYSFDIKNVVPAQPGAINGNTNVYGTFGTGTSETYNVSEIDYAKNYTWTVPGGAIITSGQGSNSITVDFGTSSGDICVTASNDCGTSINTCQTILVNIETEVVDVTNPTTGKIWMDRNLGASQVATYSTDYNAYGDLFQWGRLSDGHECINWTSSTGSDGEEQNHETITLSSIDAPGHSDFILTPNIPSDWRDPQNDNLWQGVSGTNNPCPSGYRLPTEAEWQAELDSWSTSDAAGAFASPLTLPMAGARSDQHGSFNYVGSAGGYWCSTVDDTHARSLYFNSFDVHMNSMERGFGQPVRCIKD